ncbi:MAG: 30S ribosomal protein S13 [Elusimicrobia bacterium]|nr:30S ribosomal protein S13 [Elusimicrobiota bacterium]
MARISGVDLPKEKRIDIGLSYIYGIGRVLAKQILDEAQIDPSKRVKNLTEAEVGKLASIIASDYKVEGDLRREIVGNIKRFQEVGSYKGMRHRRNLPVHGQRTKTNARTKRGKRKTVGAVKAEVKKEVETK